MTTITVIGSDGTFSVGGAAERLLTPGEVARLFDIALF